MRGDCEELQSAGARRRGKGLERVAVAGTKARRGRAFARAPGIVWGMEGRGMGL
jgi:hypothetical protein